MISLRGSSRSVIIHQLKKERCCSYYLLGALVVFMKWILNPDHANKCGIYIIWIGEAAYIGRTICLKRRLKEHKKDDNKSIPEIHQAIRKYRPNEVIMELVEECESFQESVISERLWLKLIKDFGSYNIFINREVQGHRSETIEEFQMRRQIAIDYNTDYWEYRRCGIEI